MATVFEHGQADSAISVHESDTQSKMRELVELLGKLDGLMVAYSGGIDSAFLAATAYRAIGTRMIAVIADSPSLARRDFDAACKFAESIRMPLRVVQTTEMNNPSYKKNDALRCFHCKDELFSTLERLGAELGFNKIAYGMNADDTRDYRPGQRAASEHGVLAPLAAVGLSKEQIRALAKEAGFALWDRPASPCLSSRIEYGLEVTDERLAMVEAAEEGLRKLGFSEFRVRLHGELARVEIAHAEMKKALTLQMLNAINAQVKNAGFKFVTLDTTGFHSGSMNALLPVESLVGLTAGAER